MRIITQTLNRQDRDWIRKHNNHVYPGMVFYQGINGYSKEETIAKFKESGLKYKCLHFNNYGTLANFLTKVEILKSEISRGTDYLCLIEDDIKLSSGFMGFIDNLVGKANEHNMVRLDRWGEGYIFSNAGMRRVIDIIYNNGIINNIDNQLRENCGPEHAVNNTPWEVMTNSNTGDSSKTETFNPSIFKK